MHFHFEWFSVILRLNADELLAFVYIFVECTLPRQSPIANRVLHKRQRKLIDVISYVIRAITAFCLQSPWWFANYSIFTSLVAQRVFTSMMPMRIMQPANWVLACRIPCCWSQSGLFSARGSPIHACNTTMQYAFVLHCCDVMALCTASQISNKYYKWIQSS